MKTFMKFIQEKTPVTESSSTQDVLQEILAMLRAQHWFYYNAHWQTKGENFYEQHLLFERLYGALPDEFDNLAEKLVSYFGETTVDAALLMKRSQVWIDKWSKGDLLNGAIESEKDIQKALQAGYTKIKEADDMSLGLDDYLMSTANNHETHLYLLTSVKR